MEFNRENEGAEQEFEEIELVRQELQNENSATKKPTDPFLAFAQRMLSDPDKRAFAFNS